MYLHIYVQANAVAGKYTAKPRYFHIQLFRTV